MREPRNPFRMRQAEHIESDTTFLRLFGPGVLDLLPAEDLWNHINIFRSAPGGGKTTLFRAFTPSVLNTLYSFQSNEEYKELYLRMRKLDAMSDSGPQVLGVILSCARNYATLEDLSLETPRIERLLYSLLNARIILAILRGALTLKKLQYPNDLDKLSFDFNNVIEIPSDISHKCTGQALYKWALSIERSVCNAIDSFGPPSTEFLESHDTLYALNMIKPECITLDGKPIVNRVLVMLDDVHLLSTIQRQKLFKSLFELRPSVSVWVSERLIALSPNELLAEGAIGGRELGINLENFWRSSTSAKRFENIVSNIADRRAKSARDIQISSFAGCLENVLDDYKWEEHFKTAIKVISSRIEKRISSTSKYDNWFRDRENTLGSWREKATDWKILEILIERDIRKSQLSFDFDVPLPLPSEELEEKESTSIRAAAELYIAKEFNLPYYSGMSRLATLSSSNIEQFLAFSGDLFEEIISAELLKKQPVLTPERQELILKKAVQRRWDDIRINISNGRDVQSFLKAIQQCALLEWEKGTASYGGGGGVTGIAITMSERSLLLEKSYYERLSHTISSCISYNLLEVALDRNQGGKSWMVLYLNRWLCLHFGLPLQYGGWRPKKVKELNNWLEMGFKPPKKSGGDLFELS